MTSVKGFVFFPFLFLPNASYLVFQTNWTEGPVTCFLFFLLNADMGFLLCCSISLLKLRVLLRVAFSVNTFFSGVLLILFVQCSMLNFTSLIIIIQNYFRSLVLPQWKIPKMPFLKAVFASLTDDFARSNSLTGKTQVSRSKPFIYLSIMCSQEIFAFQITWLQVKSCYACLFCDYSKLKDHEMTVNLYCHFLCHSEK